MSFYNERQNALTLQPSANSSLLIHYTNPRFIASLTRPAVFFAESF
jgi:hypothetical protein